jgi:hypothetical protein
MEYAARRPAHATTELVLHVMAVPAKRVFAYSVKWLSLPLINVVCRAAANPAAAALL